MDDRTIIETVDKTMFEAVSPLREDAVVRGWLTVWNGPLRGRDFPLREGRNFVGRDAACEIVIGEEGFGDFVLNIRIHEGCWTLIDLDSDNGLIVNDEPVFRREAQDGDWIKTGGTLLRLKKR